MSHISGKNNALRTLYQKIKGWFNYLLDRTVDLSNMFLMDIYALPWPKAQIFVQYTARNVGDLCWLIHDFPRLPAYKLAGPNWTIAFVGRDESLQEICHLFFEDEVKPQELGRVALWKLSNRVRQWLAADVNLVICELSRTYPGLPQAPIRFSVPNWIHQSLTLPEPLETLLEGKRIKSVRHNLNRAEKANFGWYFSQAREDFEHFHYNMYLPYIKSRHGSRALVANYQDQWNRWFCRGGLIIVTQNNKQVGGLLCFIKGNTCFAVEIGILDSNPDLIRDGIKISADWFAINWAYQQGARIYDMGGTRPWRSDGVFISKSRWRAKVVRRKKIYSTWTFLAQDLPLRLQTHLNRIGFISETDGKFYATLLQPEPDVLTESQVKKELAAVDRQGLDGVVIVSAHTQPIVYNSAEGQVDN